ncbi:MAG: outer membrane lipoprotein LolB [Proteobacteria bacterium]|nr:outer membrane lipoprotein LolB [Pseudomonadota bacterium]
MRWAFRAGPLCFWLILASCAELPKQAEAEMDWRDRSAQLATLSQWSASGKLAIRTESQSESANLKWTQANNISRIHLSGPMGVGATAIESDRQQLQISRNGETRRYDIATAGADMGWDLPLQALPYWILGLPSPQDPIQDELIENGLLRQVKQLGWTVTYESYGHFDQYTLPTRMKIERGDTRARLIIRNWTDFSS